jgi:hypothetical protein
MASTHRCLGIAQQVAMYALVVAAIQLSLTRTTGDVGLVIHDDRDVPVAFILVGMGVAITTVARPARGCSISHKEGFPSACGKF